MLVTGERSNDTEAQWDHERKQAFLQQCRDRNIELNTEKMQFKQHEVTYIGHWFTAERQKADPNKFKAVKLASSNGCKAYQDWRGEVSQKPLNAQKQAKQKRPIIKESDKEITTDLQDDKLKKAVTIAPESKRKISSGKCIVIKTQEKVKRIGPHLEVFEAFHARKDPSCRKVIRASIYIQKYVRGWLERTRFNRIKTKAKSHGPSLLAVVKAYRKMMNRIQRRAGVLNPSTPLRYSELEEWLDKKKFYETMFAKREFWKEMDKNDLQAFFKDCGQLLPQQQIDKVLHLVCPGHPSEVTTIKQHQALEMAFTLYPPAGAKQSIVVPVRSTWVQPIVDGEDGYIYLGAPGECHLQPLIPRSVFPLIHIGVSQE
ncbi:IQ domain-containing protein M [Caretta caretta]|uniref:IQ domain-containing protein M n=1 Tax=Caretta caretta TaxID=8467 RepID=UPI003F4B84B2